MAIYYLDVKTIGGNKGRSSIGAAAYRAGERLRNEHDGITHDYTKRRGAVGAAAYRSGQGINEHDYTRKSGIVHNEIMLPKHAPISFRDRSTLWNAAEQSERNHNARTGREVVVALPNELNTEQHIQIVRDYVQRNFVEKGMCADFSIHSGHNHTRKNETYPFQDLTVRKDNPHVHIQLTVRPLNKNGTWGAKSKKEYILDRNGKRIMLPSGNWKSRKVDSTDWDQTDTLLKWREDWAITVNRELSRQGVSERIDHRTLKEQGIDREPTKHMGHKAWNLEKKGIKTDIGNSNREIMIRNKTLEQRNQEARVKLASIQQRQRASHEPTAQAVADYMNKLSDNYAIIKNHVSDIQDNISETRRELAQKEAYIQSLQQRTDDIYKQHSDIQQAHGLRDIMQRYESEKEFNARVRRLEDTYRQSWDYYQRTYGITPDEGYQKIEQLRREYDKSYEQFSTSRHSKELDHYAQAMRQYEMEYKKQLLLAEIRPDGREIIQSLNRADTQLQRITDDDVREIAPQLRPQQAEIVRGNLHSRERTNNYHGFVR